jgi:hypothetical protein
MTADLEGPPFQENIAKLFKAHLGRDFRKSTRSPLEDRSQAAEVINKMKSFTIPSNVSDLKSCKVDECVFKAMSPSQKRESGQLAYVESALCKTMAAQGFAMSKLAELRKQLSSDQVKTVNEVFKSLAGAVEFATFARARVNDHRREKILMGLNSNYNHLLSTTKAENGLLFGDDLATAMKNVETTNRLANKLSSGNKGNQQSFLGRGPQRGRGRYRGHRGRYYQNPGRTQSQYQQQYHHHAPWESQSQNLPPPNKKPRWVA